MYVDYIFAVGRKQDRCDRLCMYFIGMISFKNMGELKWGSERGALTISQQSYAEELVSEEVLC